MGRSLLSSSKERERRRLKSILLHVHAFTGGSILEDQISNELNQSSDYFRRSILPFLCVCVLVHSKTWLRRRKMEANGTEMNQEREYIRRHHKHALLENQCRSTLVKHIQAPVHIVNLLLLLLLSCFYMHSVFSLSMFRSLMHIFLSNPI